LCRCTDCEHGNATACSSNLLHVMRLLCVWLQVGVDDVLHTWFREQQVQQAYRAAGTCSAAACRAAARTGLPASKRPWVWAAALGVHAAPPPAAAATAKAACSHANSSNSNSQAQPPTDAAALADAAAAAADMHSDWWRLPSQRDKQLLHLLCESVEQQVGWYVPR
jgi:hypothetical protein